MRRVTPVLALALGAILLLASGAVAEQIEFNPTIIYPDGMNGLQPDEFQICVQADSPDSNFSAIKFTIEYNSNCFEDPGLSDLAVGSGFTGIMTSEQLNVFDNENTMPPPQNVGQFSSGDFDRKVVVTITITDGMVVSAGNNIEVAKITFTFDSQFCANLDSENCRLHLDGRTTIGGQSTAPPAFITAEFGTNILPPTNLTMGLDLSESAIASGASRDIVGVAAMWRNFPATVVEDVDIDQQGTMNSTSTNMMGEYTLTVSPACDDVTLDADKTDNPTDDNTILGSDALLCWAEDFDPFNTILSDDEARALNVTQDCDDGGSVPCCDLTRTDVVDQADCLAIERFIAELRDPMDIASTRTWVADFYDDMGMLVGRCSSDLIPGALATETRDLKMYLLGDGDGSWPNSNPTKPYVKSRIPLAFEVEGWDDNVVTLAMKADLDEESLWAVIANFDFDPTELEFVGLSSGNATEHFRFVDREVESGNVFGMLLGTNGHAYESGSIFKLQFKSLTESPALLRFSRLYVNDRPPVQPPAIEISKGGSRVPTNPEAYQLVGWPNPFNPAARIEFTIPNNAGSQRVDLRVYDISGRLVRTLVEEVRGPGAHTVVWDGTDDLGNPARSGIYFVRARAGEWNAIQKMALVK